MNHDRIATLLSTGLIPSQVATIVGLSPGRISQIMKEPSFELLLAEKMSKTSEIDIEEESISAKYSAAEHALIKQVMDMAPVSELRDVTAALRVVGERQEKMKSRLAQLAPAQMQQLTVVSITLPSHALTAPQIQQNSQREIIALDGQTLAPLSSDAVTKLFKSMRPDEASKVLEGEYHEQSSGSISSETSFNKIASPETSSFKEGFLAYATARA